MDPLRRRILAGAKMPEAHTGKVNLHASCSPKDPTYTYAG
jgi:hypothetical protein